MCGRNWTELLASRNSTRTSATAIIVRASSRNEALNPREIGSRSYGVARISSDSPDSVEDDEMDSWLVPREKRMSELRDALQGFGEFLDR